jgi:hypothetical protein
MTLALIALFIAFTAYALSRMIAPLVSKDDSARADLLSEDLRQSEELSSLKAMYKASLRDLEIDRELEKVTEEDYLQLKREHESRAVKAMRELDQLHGGRGWQSRVDAALATRRAALAPDPEPTSKPKKKKKTKKTPEPQRATHDDPATKGAPAPDPLGALVPCASCGFEGVDAEASFCSRCGAPMPALDVSRATSSPSLSEVN